MLNRLLLAALFFVLAQANSQNLIPNPGIEEYTNCPSKLKQLDHTKHWFSANAGSPEYYNSCGLKGGIEPHSGKGMLGAIFFGAYYFDLEYLEIELRSRLKEGKEYCFSFYIQPDPNCPVINNKIGAYFSDQKVSANTWNFIEAKPQLYFEEFPVPGEWIEYKSTFIAKGGEAFLVLGNFFKKEKVNYTNYAPRKKEAWFSYYYLDDFSLLEIDDCASRTSRMEESAHLENDKTWMHSIYFDSDQFNLSLEEIEKLNEFIEQIPALNKMKISLEGHTDSDAEHSYNQFLSEQRVIAVKGFLQKNGCHSISSSWKGEESPASTNLTLEGKALNRRVNLIVKP